MTDEKLSLVKVQDIKDLIVIKPSIRYPHTPIREIMKEILKDTRSRHVYIVDKQEKLIGSIRLNNVIDYLFPTSTLLGNSQTLKVMSFISNIAARIAEDIMTRDPSYVYEETTLADMVKIMTREKVNELPVIDRDKKVIGEVNILEVIDYYLKHFPGNDHEI